MTFPYGLIGNCRTAALVSQAGSIDWTCFPRFDSPSVFAKLLDVEKGGSFSIVPVGRYATTQRYLPETNILETTFTSAKARFAVYDFFPRYREGETIVALNEIHRFFVVRRGRPRVRILFDPRFDYAWYKPVIRVEGSRIRAEMGDDRLFLYSDLNLKRILQGEPLILHREHYLMVSYGRPEYPSLSYVKQSFHRTGWYWRDYVRRSFIPVAYKKRVKRSVLMLKLLTHQSGAMVAAPTTSLPENVGGTRNWDYRYCWMRDSSFMLDAFFKLAHFDEAEAFINWVAGICRKSLGGLQVMYGLGGETDLVERSLEHLAGYRNSKPVRVGNAAYAQKQLDIYGEVIETFYLFYRHYKYHEFYEPQWWIVRHLVREVIRIWQQKDSSIWEFRGKIEHYTFSKVMCWVALDRGVKMAVKMRQKKIAGQWRAVRDAIKKDIIAKAWNAEKKSFVMFYGSDVVDASLLLMPYFGFLPAKHPRMKRTIEQCELELMDGNFTFRYRSDDDFGRPETAFIICTFWMIDALIMLGKRTKARAMFRNILKHTNHLGLFSEGTNVRTGELVGNFPQAYTHLALINTAVLLGTGAIRKSVANAHRELRRS